MFLGKEQIHTVHSWILLEVVLSKHLHGVVPGSIHTELDRNTELNIPKFHMGEICLY